MNKVFAQAVLNLLVYIVEYLNNVSMIWNREKADTLLNAVRDEVFKMREGK